MQTKDYKHLLSGSDVRGVAVEGLHDQPVTLTAQDAAQIAQAFVAWMRKEKPYAAGHLTLAVGADSRISSPALAGGVIGALAGCGCRVLDLGMASTPAMFMTTLPELLDCDGAVMVTASHLPYNRNGLKFFTRQGGLEHEDVAQILEMAGHGLPAGSGSVEKVDFMPRYAAHLADKIRRDTGLSRPFEGLRIIVDAGNGVGGFFVEQVLKPLGADTCGSQYLEPDGMFPHHIPNPEDAEAMAAIRDAVLRNQADLGIIFDTDCDRAAVVDASGSEINRNRLVALMAAIVLRKHPGATIVTDSVTSAGLKDFITGLGGVHYRYRRGYRNVIDEAIRLRAAGTNAPLAMETSGHCALEENYDLDDGAYLVTLVLIEMARLRREGKSLSSLLQGLREPAEAAEARLNIQARDFAAYGQRVLEKVLAECERNKQWHLAPDNREGVRVSFDAAEGDGWFLLRMSLHDPVLPLNIESDAEGGVAAIAAHIYPVLLDMKELDLTQLEAIL